MVAPIKLRPDTKPSCFLALSLAVLPLGCSGAGGAAPASSYDISNLPSIELVEELRIGSLDDPQVGFADPGTVMMAENGDVYVFENQAMEIRRYSASGDLLGTIGRRGAGPGEFERPPQFGVRDGTVWTFEIPSLRLTFFSEDGSVRSALVLDEGIPQTMMEDGRMIVEMTAALAHGGPRAGAPAEGKAVIPIVVMGQDGSVHDTIRSREGPPPPQALTLVGSPPLAIPRPPADSDLEVQLSDGWITIERPTPSTPRGLLSIRRQALSGDTLYSSTYSYLAPENDAAFLDATARQSASMMLSAFTAGFSAGSGQRLEPPTVEPERLEQIRSAMDFPRFRPLVQSLVAGDDGTMWLRREEAIEDHERWMLIDADGIPRGVVDLPSSHRIAATSGETMWAVVLGEYDVPWLVRYRLQPAR